MLPTSSLVVVILLFLSFDPIPGLPISLQIPWKEFIARSDPVWEWTPTANVPTKWYHSAFVGNGALGMMIRVNETNSEKTLVFDVSSSEVWDDREKDSPYSLDNNFVYDRPRLPVGQFFLQTVGTITHGRMRLNLFDAEVTGKVTTTEGV